jgi:hypothetical protein
LKLIPSSFVPLETHHESKASILQCLKEPSYAKILKDLYKQAHKSKNHHPKENISKQASWLPKMAKHHPRVLSNFKEEMVEGIGWTST